MKHAIATIAAIGLVAVFAAGCEQNPGEGPRVGPGTGRVNNEQPGRAQQATPGGAAGNYSNPHAPSSGAVSPDQ
jgi:hypothetical protein